MRAPNYEVRQRELKAAWKAAQKAVAKARKDGAPEATIEALARDEFSAYQDLVRVEGNR